MAKSVLAISLFMLTINSVAQELLPPKLLKAEYVKSDSGQFIYMAWEKNSNDSLSVGYEIFNSIPSKEGLFLNGVVGTVYDSEKYLRIYDNYASEYKLAVSSVLIFPEVIRSPKSNILSVRTESIRLPLVQIVSCQKVNDQIKIEWSYQDNIADLKGFEVLINDKTLLTAEDLPFDKRKTSVMVEEAKSYSISMKAVSQFGIKSEEGKLCLVKD